MNRSAILWRLHCSAPPAEVYAMWSTDVGRERFWAERSQATSDGFVLRFIDGTQERVSWLAAVPGERLAFTYFGSTVEIVLAGDGGGGTDLTLTNEGVADGDYEEVHAGWLNVLFPLKAAVDFGIDLRNHDPQRTWRQAFVDQ